MTVLVEKSGDSKSSLAIPDAINIEIKRNTHKLKQF
jgi:hypothetical protein